MTKMLENGRFFRKQPFVRLAKQVLQDLPEPDVRFSKQAIADMQTNVEEQLEFVLDATRRAAEHASRKTIQQADIDLVLEIARASSNYDPEEEISDGEDPSRKSRVRPKKTKDTMTSKEASPSSEQKKKVKKFYADNEYRAISAPSIQRAASKVEIKRVGEDVYGHCIYLIVGYLERFIADAVVSAKHNRRYTIKPDDILDASKIHKTF